MNEALKIVVLAKQVPDTRNVGKDAMKADGTVNRAALAAIFNPEDLNALEQALRLKDRYPKSTITLLTMGPARAAEIIREAMFRGADGGILLTDRKFAGADTLATSYTLSCGAKKIAPDVIIAGRQAIDGDTAQVGPQVAQKLGWPQVTYAEAIEAFDAARGELTVKRRLEAGVETVVTTLPAVITVNGSAPECRPQHAKMVLKYKHARTESEAQEEENGYFDTLNGERAYLRIGQWGAAELGGDEAAMGLSGSPTKVRQIENVVFQAKEAKKLTAADEDVDELMKELIASHTIG